jgi:hypothetical protein
VIHIKSRLPTFEEIDKMIEEEFMSSGIVESFNRIEPSDPSVRGKYSTRLNIDEKLDTYKTIRAKVKQYVNEELLKALVEIGSTYKCSKIVQPDIDEYIKRAAECR